MRLHGAREGVGIAFDALRSNKLRSALTILGVVIGVATVMTMASLVQGIRRQIFNAIETAGPTAFYVVRYFSQTPLNPDRLPYEVRIRPVLQESDAAAVRRVPEIAYAGMWVQLFQRVEYLGARTQTVTVFGADDGYMEIQGGTLLRGRFFTRGELSGDPVVVLETDVADRLFGQIEPIGRYVRIGGKSLRVIGIYQKPGNIFEPPGQEVAGVIPFETARQNYRYDETNSLFIAAKPRSGVTVEQARDLVTAALRRARNLRPGMPNTFDLITQDQILAVVGKFTSYFFLAMVSLSSVALLVGGIGVMAIMMVSVTDRTREIGLRKALGATRREILWQFLVEAATLTCLGGLAGIAIGVLAGELLKLVLRLEAGPPLWSALLAVAVSIAIGLTFGLYPANRAARLDPVEALRHE
ncbi:MAG TPA: ABC transporter permease [Gemmatimonadales bacterium]|jgi:putative ABC transport system permease protein|nr:ABC transporter permease [Gemmatimonadales bacterium]